MLVVAVGCSSAVRGPVERVALSDEELTGLGDAASDVLVFPSRRIVVRYGDETVAIPQATSGRIVGQARVGGSAMLFVCFESSCAGADDAYRFTLAGDGSYRLTRAPLRPGVPDPAVRSIRRWSCR